MTENEKILSAALLWLRNHYECVTQGGIRDPECEKLVVDRIERVLKDFPCGVADLRTLRELYPLVVR